MDRTEAETGSAQRGRQRAIAEVLGVSAAEALRWFERHRNFDLSEVAVEGLAADVSVDHVVAEIEQELAPSSDRLVLPRPRQTSSWVEVSPIRPDARRQTSFTNDDLNSSESEQGD